MADEIKNCYLVNAPAGSGKTTSIKSMIKNVISTKPNDNLLCITYTNRAADELAKDFTMKNIFIGTIHSFLNNFMRRYFAHSDILKLYFEEYGDKINARILNKENKENIQEGNNKYVEKNGELSYEIVKKNIHEIYYNESSFNSLYYGGLCHDDLISFSKLIFDRYPIIRKRIVSKYQYVFIDEYQDTMADVLKIFFESVVGTNCELYLFGDKMQQIYKNYDGSFEKEFSHFDTSISLNRNYRSSSEIVNILNNIYNDKVFVQTSALRTENDNELDQPLAIFSNDVEKSLNNILSKTPNILVLYLLNKSRFAAIGAANLYVSFSHMERYSYEKNYAVILTSTYTDNPDPLLRLLYCLMEMFKYYQEKQYGVIIQELKFNSPRIFCSSMINIKSHSDKLKLGNCFEQVFTNLNKEISISEYLYLLKETGLVNKEYIEELINDLDYKTVLTVSINEPKCIFNYLSDPKVSTQHGVKGESHDSVVFVADDSNNIPIVHMYSFFDMFSKIPVSLTTFNSFYYDYLTQLNSIEREINMKLNKLNSVKFNENKEKLLSSAENIMNRFQGNLYFEFLCKKKFSEFLNKPNVTKAQECYKVSTVYGVLSAYKLFYVGCSRARKRLTVLINISKIKGSMDAQKAKFEELGFITQME